jgi:hypothetical protein
MLSAFVIDGEGAAKRVWNQKINRKFAGKPTYIGVYQRISAPAFPAGKEW